MVAELVSPWIRLTASSALGTPDQVLRTGESDRSDQVDARVALSLNQEFDKRSFYLDIKVAGDGGDRAALPDHLSDLFDDLKAKPPVELETFVLQFNAVLESMGFAQETIADMIGSIADPIIGSLNAGTQFADQLIAASFAQKMLVVADGGPPAFDELADSLAFHIRLGPADTPNAGQLDDVFISSDLAVGFNASASLFSDIDIGDAGKRPSFADLIRASLNIIGPQFAEALGSVDYGLEPGSDGAITDPTKDPWNNPLLLPVGEDRFIAEALLSFRSKLRTTLAELGIDADMFNQLVRPIVEKIRDAMESGLDFSTQLMLAAETQTRSIDDDGADQIYELSVKSLEIEVNHDAEEPVLVRVGSASVRSRQEITGDGDTPDSRKLTDAEQAVSREVLDQLTEQSRTLARRVIDRNGLPTMPKFAIDTPNDPFPSDADTDVPVEANHTPLQSRVSYSSSRVNVETVEHRVNERQERITRLVLDIDIAIPFVLAPGPEAGAGKSLDLTA